MTSFFSTNWFDLAIYVCLFVAVVMGFMTGLLRSLATIFGYIAGMGVAVVAAPRVTPLLTTYLKMPTLQTWIVIVAIFVAAGAVLSALLRLALNENGRPQYQRSRSRCRRGTWGAPHRAARHHARRRFRPDYSAGPGARLPEKLANGGRCCPRRRSAACATCRPRSRPISTA